MAEQESRLSRFIAKIIRIEYTGYSDEEIEEHNLRLFEKSRVLVRFQKQFKSGEYTSETLVEYDRAYQKYLDEGRSIPPRAVLFDRFSIPLGEE